MKVGILTYHFAYNYGAMLQAYALQQTVIKLGHTCNLIDYRPYAIDKAYHFYFKDIIFAPHKFFYNIFENENKGKKFDQFMKDNLILSKKVKNSKMINKKKYDAIITGSDQIWNLDISHNDFIYFLDGIEDSVNKIAYAPSIKNYDVLEKYKYKIGKLLSKYDYLSGRENDVVEFIESHTNVKDINHVMDPVYLLEEKDWIKIISQNRMFTDRYILFYVLGEEKEYVQLLNRVQENRSIKTIVIHPIKNNVSYGDIFLNNIGPQDFLNLIYNADIVITDSFHCFSFSIIFRKIVILGNCIGNRLQNIINIANLKQKENNVMKYYQSSDDNLDNLKTYINNSRRFLEKALNGNGKE